tara:strand:- start:3 stop:503 length:501 start_codon:yes stop_codon:yes gene_type:complete
MSRESNINNISNTLTQEEDDLVNSILQEINEKKPSVNAESSVNLDENKASAQQMTPQQMAQQQMAQQQMAQQQMAQQQMAQQQMVKLENKDTDSTNKEEYFNQFKEPILISIISFILLLPQVNNIFMNMGIPFIFNDSELNMVGIIFKCLLIAIIYYIVKTFIIAN